MSRIRIWLAVAITIVGACSTSRADMIISVDLSPLGGVQNTTTLKVGDTFTANLVMELQLNPPNKLDSYGFSVDYDPIGLQFVSATPFPLTDFFSVKAPMDLKNVPHVVSPFEASSNVFGQGPSVVPQTVVGGITFRVLAASGPGGFLLRPFEIPLDDGSFDNSFNQIPTTFRGGTINVTAVPEPTSLALLGLVATVVLYRRRKSWLSMR